jgi:hypothetical protein
MSNLIDLCRTKIHDPAGVNQQFSSLDIQNALDIYRDDIVRELLQAAPSIVNEGNNSHQAEYIWADYYSSYQFWESDVVLQGNNTTTGAPWIVLMPLASELLVGHFQLQLDVFNTGVSPGQYPPVYATGKTYDIWAACADLLDSWSASMVLDFDFSSDGQSFKASQKAAALQTLANRYRSQAKPRIMKMVRRDVAQRSSNFSDNPSDTGLIRGR